MEGSLQIERFEHPISASEFESLIETRNIPAVFVGCVKDWKAISKWNPIDGGLHYLQEFAGSCIVEAMLSRSPPVFYGNLRSHERVPLPFSLFIGFCKQLMKKRGDYGDCSSSESETNGMTRLELEDDCLSSETDSRQFYLAQVPILNSKEEGNVQLEVLREDIHTPTFLERKKLASINLWMNSSQSRSSTHYDPHHNILCIVAGVKQVMLWPPSASPMLYPMPIHGEASNHSSVALEDPDYLIHPRAKSSMEYTQKVVLHAGDALFIPEGWFHQVDSDDLTIAVNFWWQSQMMSSMPEHMDVYYLRRILRRLVDREMNQVLCEASPSGMVKMERGRCEIPRGEKDQNFDHLDQACQKKDLQMLEPRAVQALHGLVSVVHDCVSVSNQGQQPQSAPRFDSASIVKDEVRKMNKTTLNQLEDDLIAHIIWNMESCILQSVLLAMAHNFPRTLEALILHLLSPVGAEVLTRKFDEMDQNISEGDRTRFYEVFYGAFDDQFAAMDAILNGKESFARQAYKNVLDKYLGLKLDEPKPVCDGTPIKKLVPPES